jgi:hypothetical protein
VRSPDGFVVVASAVGFGCWARFVAAMKDGGGGLSVRDFRVCSRHYSDHIVFDRLVSDLAIDICISKGQKFTPPFPLLAKRFHLSRWFFIPSSRQDNIGINFLASQY